MGEPGRPSVYTPELLSDIREGLLAGKTQESIKEELGIANSTWCRWFYDNYQGFRDQVEGWRRDALLKQAEGNIKEIIHLPISAEDPKVMKIIADTSIFVTETIGKNSYSKKQDVDVTTKGEPITGINYIVPNGNNIKSNT